MESTHQQRMNRTFVYANMVRLCIILCPLWHRCLNTQKVRKSSPPSPQSNYIIIDTNFLYKIKFSDLIKDSARPSYWVPDRDREANFCCVCTKPFGTAEDLVSNAKKQSSNPTQTELLNDSSELVGMTSSAFCDRRRHHCRSCGQAVCDFCSQNRKPVPERGWNSDVRVCDCCNKKSPVS